MVNFLGGQLFRRNCCKGKDREQCAQPYAVIPAHRPMREALYSNLLSLDESDCYTSVRSHYHFGRSLAFSQAGRFAGSLDYSEASCRCATPATTTRASTTAALLGPEPSSHVSTRLSSAPCALPFHSSFQCALRLGCRAAGELTTRSQEGARRHLVESSVSCFGASFSPVCGPGPYPRQITFRKQ